MILRVVVRESMSLSLVNQLFIHICEATKFVLDTARPVSTPDIPYMHQQGESQPELSDWHMVER
jgi:hypothetical protein